MKINNIVWNDIIVSHQTRKKDFRKNDHIDYAHILIRDNLITLIGYDESGFYNDINWSYGNPKLIRLSSFDCVVEAEWFGSTYYINKQGKHVSKNLPRHKVKITAKF